MQFSFQSVKNELKRDSSFKLERECGSWTRKKNENSRTCRIHPNWKAFTPKIDREKQQKKKSIDPGTEAAMYLHRTAGAKGKKSSNFSVNHHFYCIALLLLARIASWSAAESKSGAELCVRWKSFIGPVGKKLNISDEMIWLNCWEMVFYCGVIFFTTIFLIHKRTTNTVII